MGYAQVSSGYSHAFLWEGDVVQDLGTLGGNYSFAYDISASGQVVGRAYIANGDSHAFLWEDGAMDDLGTLGSSYSEARGINALGQVVGRSGTVDGEGHAFLWENGVMYDLNDLVPNGSEWVLQYAFDTNDRGQIVGYGWRSGFYDGQCHAVLLTPIPEPAGLGVVGVALLVAMRRLRRGCGGARGPRPTTLPRRLGSEM